MGHFESEGFGDNSVEQSKVRKAAIVRPLGEEAIGWYLPSLEANISAPVNMTPEQMAKLLESAEALYSVNE